MYHFHRMMLTLMLVTFYHYHAIRRTACCVVAVADVADFDVLVVTFVVVCVCDHDVDSVVTSVAECIAGVCIHAVDVFVVVSRPVSMSSVV
jgi:hypothetical protein